MRTIKKLQKCKKKELFVAGLLLGLFLLGPAFSSAQLSTASVHGSVTDPQGSKVANATIVLKNVDTSVKSTTVSSGSGAYTLLNITPGSYTIEANATGFSRMQVPAFLLTVGQQATIDFSLTIGTITSEVTVEGTTPQLEASSANLGTVIATRQVNDLPLNGRNFTQLLLLTPGVSPINTSQNGGTAYGAPIAQNSSFSFPAINGQTSRSNYFLADGLSDFISYQSTYAVPPIIDAIQEFKVVSHTDSAEYGSVLGGVVNVVTKSGTNGLHGSAWEYARNAIFNARSYFQPTSVAKTPFSENQFGGSVGGPVIIPKLYNGKNKTFFFGAYQGLRYNASGTSLYIVPTNAQLAGDESDWPTQLYNPFSTVPNPDPLKPGQYVRSPYPGNQIPVNPLMVTWAKAIYPVAGPVIDSAGHNAYAITQNTQTQDEWTARVDQTFGAHDSAWFRYSTSNTVSGAPNGLPGGHTATTIKPTNFGGSYVHVFSPSLILQVQYGRTTATQKIASLASQSASVISAVGFAPSFVGTYISANGGNLLPALGITGYSGIGESVSNYPNLTGTNEYSGSLTKLWGKHSLHVGGGYIHMTQALSTGYPSLGFSGAQTGDTNPLNSKASGDPLASFLLGVPDSATRVNRSEDEHGGGVLSAFVQDSWRVTNNLTLNYGLRYDVTYIPHLGSDKTVGINGGPEAGDYDFSNGTYILQKVPPLCSVRGHAPCMPGDGSLPAHVVIDPRGTISHNVYDNLGPRFGFAYKLGEKTVIRGAFGIVYDNWAGAAQLAQNIAGAWPSIGNQLASNLNRPSAASATPMISATDPFAGNGSSLFPAATPFGQVGYFYDPHIKNPYSEQWNFGVQRVLNQSTSVTVDYVGSVSKRLDIGGYYNTALTPGPGDPKSRALYTYASATVYDRSIGEGNYNALQVSLDKRYVDGFAFQVAYTWSKAIDVAGDGWFGAEGGIGGEVPQDPYHPFDYGSRSVAGFDLTHILTINSLYQIPVGRGRKFSTGNGFADYVLGNWQLNNIFSARSGQPFTPYISSDIANTGNITSRGYEHANLIGNPHLAKRTAAEWFNTAAYVTPPGFTFGTTPRNSLRSAPYWNLDTSVFREFPMGSDRHLEIRAEAFNLLNNVVFGVPTDDLNTGTKFGTISSTANGSRQLQLAAKFIF